MGLHAPRLRVRTQASNGIQPVLVPLMDQRVPRVHRGFNYDGQKNVRRIAAEGVTVELRGGYSNQGNRQTFNDQSFANELRIGGKLVKPRAVAYDGHRSSAGLVVLRIQKPACGGI